MGITQFFGGGGEPVSQMTSYVPPITETPAYDPSTSLSEPQGMSGMDPLALIQMMQMMQPQQPQLPVIQQQPQAVTTPGTGSGGLLGTQKFNPIQKGNYY